MTLWIIVILLGIFCGLLIGLLPGAGHPMLMILTFPLLTVLPPHLVLIFYIVSVQASEFSGSVSALGFGLLGEITSQPGLIERPTVIAHQAIDVAFKYTAISSVIGCCLVMIPFPYLLEWFHAQPFMMRTEVVSLFSVLVFASVIFWKENRLVENVLLLSIGIIMSRVGFQSNGGGSTETHFLTFGQSFLADGFPTIAVLGGFLAMHAWFEFQSKAAEPVKFDQKPTHDLSFPWASSLRGSLIGSVVGLIPMVGSIMSSTLAHQIEKKFFHAKSDIKSCLARLSAAESANNSSFITVLIPLMVIGVAIIPSQMILINYLEIKNWTAESMNQWRFFGLNFYVLISISLAIAAAVSYFFCYTIVAPLAKFCQTRINLLNSVTFVVMLAAVIYAGSEVRNTIFFIVCFVAFSLISYRFRKTSFLPLIAGFLLGDQTIDNLQILQSLYF